MALLSQWHYDTWWVWKVIAWNNWWRIREIRMEVVFTKDVVGTLNAYRESLKTYPISSERAHQKCDALMAALESLGSLPMTPPICMHRDLLQTFESNGEPRCKELRRYNYKDESGFPWAFSCLYNKAEALSCIREQISNYPYLFQFFGHFCG